MKYLIFDTETTNLPNRQLSLEHSDQARICQLACLLVDQEFNELSVFCSFIKPDRWNMNPKALDRHGISVQLCEECGISIETALRVFEGFVLAADKCVAHGLSFDTSMLDIELALAGRSSVFDYKDGSWLCTMLASTPICKLPSKFGNGQYKWPKLSEAYSFFVGTTFINQHDALADVKATAKVFQCLVNNKILTLT